MFKNRSKVVFSSLVVGVLYLIYIVSFFTNGITSSDSTKAIASGIAAILIFPHMILLVFAIIFNLIGFISNRKWCVITGLALYGVSALLFILYAIFLIPSIVLSAIGIDKVTKINESKNCHPQINS